jgi:DNA-binding transcriptional ArsR family regulator
MILYIGLVHPPIKMTKFPYDSFAKDYLKELLSPLGSVETSKDVAGEVREIDVYFAPNGNPQIDKKILGLLGKFADKKALIEPFRNAVTKSEVRSCTAKLLDTCARFEREAKRNNTSIDEDSLPRLWILSPTASKDLLGGFGGELNELEWGSGIYFFDESWRGAIVAIHQLPVNPETLWLRLLGKGRVQQRAIEEVQALDINNPLRSKAIDLLANLKTTLELNQSLDVEDREFVMQLSPIYEQRLAEAIQQGRQEGRQEGEINERRTIIENLLRVRFGSEELQLSAIIEPLLALPPEEFSSLLLQLSNLSREDLLTRFTQQ